MALLGVSLANISTAFAQPTKVALTIEGDSSSIGLRRAVVAALDESDVEFVSAKKTTQVIEKLGIGEVTSARDAKKVATKLDVNTVVQGAFDESDRTVTFTIFTKGKSRSTSFTLDVDSARSASFRRAVRKKMLAKLALPAKETEDDDADETPASAPKKTSSRKVAEADAKPERKAVHEERARHPKEVAREDTEDPEAEDADRDEPPTSAHARIDTAPDKNSIHGLNLTAIRVDVGASMTGRSLKFKSSAFEGAPSSYRAKPVPGGHLEAELYPAAISDRTSVLAGLGIAGDVDQATSFTAPASDGTTPLKVTERHYSVGARFRFAFGHRPTSPTLTIGVGYGARTFAVDHSSGMTIDLPDVDYRMIDPGLAARVPLGRRVALTAGGRALLLTSAGPIADLTQYGAAHVVGGTGSAGVEVMIGNHVAVRVAAEGTQLDFKFYGNGMLATSRDGDPSTIDVQRAVDRYYGGEATVAIMY
jgi:hypothetical protein